MPALDCTRWGNGKSTEDHCNAEATPYWKELRSKGAPASRAAADQPRSSLPARSPFVAGRQQARVPPLPRLAALPEQVAESLWPPARRPLPAFEDVRVRPRSIDTAASLRPSGSDEWWYNPAAGAVPPSAATTTAARPPQTSSAAAARRGHYEPRSSSFVQQHYSRYESFSEPSTGSGAGRQGRGVQPAAGAQPTADREYHLAPRRHPQPEWRAAEEARRMPVAPPPAPPLPPAWRVPLHAETYAAAVSRRAPSPAGRAAPRSGSPPAGYAERWTPQRSAAFFDDAVPRHRGAERYADYRAMGPSLLPPPGFRAATDVAFRAERSFSRPARELPAAADAQRRAFVWHRPVETAAPPAGPPGLTPSRSGAAAPWHHPFSEGPSSRRPAADLTPRAVPRGTHAESRAIPRFYDLPPPPPRYVPPPPPLAQSDDDDYDEDELAVIVAAVWYAQR